MADRRGSSIAAAVDAAIERVVDDFESNDLALRLDVLRALSAQSQLAFETTRVRQRLRQHPVAMDLIGGVTSQSPVYEQLAERLTVDSSSCDYDSKRNVVMKTSVRWTLKPKEKKSKKRKKVAASAASEAMVTSYRYERVRAQKDKEEGDETLLKFTVVVAFGDDTKPKELVHFELACDHLYPKSYYEEMQQLPSDEEEEDEERNADESDKKSEKEEESSGNKDADEGKDESFGEELRAFRFDNEVLADIGAWMGAGEEELDPVDVVGFFMALPVHEDEWLVDERVCEILFQGGLGGDSSDEEDSESGGNEEDGDASDEPVNEGESDDD
ncbi:hypothetical protein PHYBOEH_002950 [Phytophthora boehmeriae]|uniref:Nucleosome assembly protein n=1 Tax=Phytophthora boehmeriae TaxID=109152 RepID=A0A8T1WR94_9STRA|nr:hypothetical protein PHYBOEH_002950 [Phytophthora boehmeriae]